MFCDNFDGGCLGNPPPGNVPGTTVRVPAVVGLFMNAGKRWRPSANASFQYKVNPDLQFYVDGLFQGFRRRSFNVPLFAFPSYTNVGIAGQGNLFSYPSGLTANVLNCCRPDGFQSATREKTARSRHASPTIGDPSTCRSSRPCRAL